MRVTIVSSDNTMMVDGQLFLVDLKPLRDQGIHAVQFYNDGWGEVEHIPVWLKDEGRYDCKPNKVIKNLNDFKSYMDQWNDCKRRADLRRKAMEEDMQRLLTQQNESVNPPHRDRR
jgi:hypothetical protein